MVINLFFYQANLPKELPDYLKNFGYNVLAFSSETYSDALLALDSEFFDVCIVDISQDADNRFSLVDRARKMDITVPVILLSDDLPADALLEAYDNHNIDTHVFKPYDFNVLVAQINAIMRRAKTERAHVENTYSIGKYKIDMDERKIILGDSLIRITPREASVLNYLCMFKNKSIPKADIQNEIWGEVSYATKNNMVNKIKQLRRYFSADPRIKIIAKEPGYIGLFVEDSI